MQKIRIYLFDENRFREYCESCGLSNVKITRIQTMLVPTDKPMVMQIIRIIERQYAMKGRIMPKKIVFVFNEDEFLRQCRKCGLSDDQTAKLKTILIEAKQTDRDAVSP